MEVRSRLGVAKAVGRWARKNVAFFGVHPATINKWGSAPTAQAARRLCRRDEREEIAALKSAGFGIGEAGDFLDLSPHESELVNLGLALTRTLCAARKRAGITQAELAKKIGFK